ncbi:hypothetical protein SPHINGOT1_660071 [Sphingomonas sp. T1]|nr:hypothetical protein SPHINGOT1_660071 [Sphingomonas sp. T1]
MSNAKVQNFDAHLRYPDVRLYASLSEKQGAALLGQTQPFARLDGGFRKAEKRS